MAIQYAYENLLDAPEFEYQAEELKKKLQSAMANFAQIRFKRAMKARISLTQTIK